MVVALRLLPRCFLYSIVHTLKNSLINFTVVALPFFWRSLILHEGVHGWIWFDILLHKCHKFHSRSNFLPVLFEFVVCHLFRNVDIFELLLQRVENLRYCVITRLHNGCMHSLKNVLVKCLSHCLTFVLL